MTPLNPEYQLLLATQNFLLYRSQLQELIAEKEAEGRKVRSPDGDTLIYKRSYLTAKIRQADQDMKKVEQEIQELLLVLSASLL